MSYIVQVKSGQREVPSEGAARGLILQIQNVLGADAQIEIIEVIPTYDGNTSKAKEVGRIQRLVEKWPPEEE